jgi:hypothetical protein
MVEVGGNGGLSLLTDWRRQHAAWPGGRVGLDMPPGPQDANKPVKRTFGKGRVVYIPRIEASTTPPPPQMNYASTNEHWRLPKNHRDLIEAVKWAAGDELRSASMRRRR